MSAWHDINDIWSYASDHHDYPLDMVALSMFLKEMLRHLQLGMVDLGGIFKVPCWSAFPNVDLVKTPPSLSFPYAPTSTAIKLQWASTRANKTMENVYIDPELGGAWITMCLPSIVPIQLGKFHIL